jgi:K+-sensing histidine kinase KdpD
LTVAASAHDPIARSFVVDEGRRVVESDATLLAVGSVVARSSWLGESTIDALDAAVRTGRAQRRTARDGLRGTHWILQVAVTSLDPWRARVTAIDATQLVQADREAVFAKIVHSMRNVSFALQSVLEAIEAERPTGPELDEYLSHLRDPADRLAATMSRLAACITPARLARKSVRVDELVAAAVSRAVPGCKPERVVIAEPPLLVSADADLIADVVTAMLESGGDHADPALEVGEAIVESRRHARIIVDRKTAVPGERAGADLWDLAAGRGLEIPLRLAFGRDVVREHGGEVLVEDAKPGRVRLGISLPVIDGP